MSRIAWQLSDPVTAEVYDLPINPNQGGTPTHKKNIQYQNTSAPGGKVLMFEGREDAKTISVSGSILEQTLLDQLVVWYNRRNPVELTDDLGRIFRVYITSFNPTRIRRATRPYYHEYTMDMTILDW